MDRIHEVYIIEQKNFGKDICGPESGLQKRATTRPDYLWSEIWSSMLKAAHKREKHEWAIEKPKLDNARRLTGIYFIDPEDGEHKETIQNARKMLERPMKAATPCKNGNEEAFKQVAGDRQRNQRYNKIQKTKHACIVEAHESTRKRVESIQSKDHGAQICSRAQGIWEKPEKSQARHLNKVKSQKEVILEAQREKRVHFATLMNICHLKKCGVGTKVSKVQGTSPAPR